MQSAPKSQGTVYDDGRGNVVIAFDECDAITLSGSSRDFRTVLRVTGVANPFDKAVAQPLARIRADERTAMSPRSLGDSQHQCEQIVRGMTSDCMV